MIVTKNKFYTLEEIEKLKEKFQVYIKTVIDIKKKICSAGMHRHFEGEKILLKQGSKQKDIWGGGLDLETDIVDFQSMVNIRPKDNNPSTIIQNNEIQLQYKQLSEYFFKKIL